MEFNVKTGHPEKQRSACLVVGVFENRKLSPLAAHLDDISQGYLTALLKKGDLEGKLGQTLLLHQVPNITSDRILLVGCGREHELHDNQFRDIIRKMLSSLLTTGAQDAVCSLSELTVTNRDLQWKIRQAVEITCDMMYSFDSFKTKKEPKRAFSRLTFTLPSRREISLGERAIFQGQAIASGVQFAKDLANQPPNVCTPSYMAKSAEKLSSTYPRLSTAILNEKDIRALKMGALLAVAQGSTNAPRFITMEYRGTKDKQKPVILIGKGITFDTGGNSLKPAAGMIGMKYDMSAGAAVLGTLKTVAELELPINVVGVVPAAENMPGAAAARPEDVITTLSGQTVEILNTDAEGRLILADALTYCERFDPDVVIDLATLTGACVMALGRYPNGLFSNHNPLANDLMQAGQTSGDRCWQLPLWEEYQEALSSHCADMANVGPAPEGGAIVAACFLSRFAKSFHWAHLDIAGTASVRTGKERGATGRPVPLLAQYLINRCS